ALAVLAVALLIPESHSAKAPSLDPVGVVLSVVGLVAVTYGMIQSGGRGWGDARALGFMAAGILVLAALGGWQRRAPPPRAPTAGRPGPVPLAQLHLGDDPVNAAVVRADRVAVRGAAVLPRGARLRRDGRRSSAASVDRRDDRRPGRGRPDLRQGRTEAHRRAGIRDRRPRPVPRRAPPIGKRHPRRRGGAGPPPRRARAPRAARP